MASIQYGNFCYSELLTAIDSDDTSVVVLSGEGARFPATTNGSFYICVWDKYYKTAAEAYQNSCAEIMLCTARASDTLTVTRAQQSTTARSFNTTGRTYGVDHIVTATDITQPAGKKTYKALLTQTSTNAPSAAVLENTLGGAITWSRDSEGVYIGTCSITTIFATVSKIVLMIGNIKYDYSVGIWVAEVQVNDDGSVMVETALYAGTPGTNVALHKDGILSTVPITIEVYP
jgi:hypothetical protein